MTEKLECMQIASLGTELISEDDRVRTHGVALFAEVRGRVQ